MNGHVEGNSNSQSNYSLLEHDKSRKDNVYPAKLDPIDSYSTPRDPQILKAGEYDDILTKARQEIAEKNIAAKVISAIKKKTEGNSVRLFAEVENDLTELCLELKESEIDSIVRQLNSEILKLAGNVEFASGKIRQEVLTGKWKINSVSIKSVVAFIRYRCKLLSIKPEQDFILGFNNYLDATAKIDLIEIVFDKTSSTHTLNLIQIKSSIPAEDEMAEIIDSHRRFVNQDLVKNRDIELYKPNEQVIKKFEVGIHNQEEFLERIFDICLDYNSVDKSKLEHLLGMNELTIIQKAWLLNTHFEFISSVLDEASEYIGEENKAAMLSDLQKMRDDLVRRSGLPVDTIRIGTVNSIIACGAKEVRNKTIYNSEQGHIAVTRT